MSTSSDAPEVDSAPVAAPREIAAGVSVGQVILKPRKSQPFFGRHPWVLDSAIARVEGEVSDGDVVDLQCDKGRFIARGLVQQPQPAARAALHLGPGRDAR